MRVRSTIGRSLLGIAAGTLVLPAVAAAGGSGGATAPTGSTEPVPASGPASTAGAMTIAPATLMRGQDVLVTGTLPSAAGRAVWLQVRAGRRAWTTIASATAGRGGAFTISWAASRAGELTLRVASPTLASKAAVTATSPLSATPSRRVSVFDRVIATWYGPGFYGNHTACGETLTRQLVGVADRTLPCGTPVTISYAGRTLTVPVIDRGPFSGPATLDLTHAAAQELGMTQTVPVGMLARRGATLAPTDYLAPGTGATGATGPASTAGGATAPSD